MKDPYDLIYHPNTFFGNPLYQYHTRPYNSIEKLDDYFVAVGEETFATNKSGTWNEVITNKGTGQKVNYNKIKKLTGNQFLVSGNNGFFKKGILK